VVALEGGRLVFRHNEKYVADLEPWEGDTFKANWRDPMTAQWAGRRITFVVEGGRAKSLRATFDNEVVFSR
jgi:hypothetical protein